MLLKAKMEVKMNKRLLISVIVLSLALFLSACGESSPSSEKKGEVNVFNWGEYIDMDVLEAFEKETGYKVNYSVFSTNEEMFPKVENGADSYDVIIPSDYTIQRMIEADLLQELNFENIPNYENVNPVLKNTSFDPENKYSVPYAWGTVGILYNTKMVDDVVDSWKILFNEKYSGKIFMYDSERDSFMVALTLLGYSMNTKDVEEINKAKELLISQKPLILAYVVDEAMDKMIAGEAALSLAWSGEAMATIKENPDLKYVIPKEGSNIWIDSMVIPKTAQNKEGAEAFINFMLKDEIAKKNMIASGYTSSNMNVKDLIDEEWASNIAAYPPKDATDRCEVFQYSPETTKLMGEAWLEIKQ